MARPRGEVAERLSVSYPNTHLKDLVLGLRTKKKLERVIREQRVIYLIRSSGLSPRRKLLLVGPPGTGKTLTASALAGELGLPLSSLDWTALSPNLWARPPPSCV